MNSSIRVDNPNNEFNFKNTVIVNDNFVVKIDIENNVKAKALVTIVLPDTFKDLFVYEYAKNHLYIKNQRSLFKITKNTIISFKDKNTSFDKLLKERKDLNSTQMKTQYLMGNHE